MVVLMVLAAGLEGLGIGLLIPFLESLLRPEGDPLRTGWQWVDTWVLASDAPKLERLYWLSGVILLSIWTRAGVGYVANLLNIRIRESILHRLRREIIDQVQRVAVSFFSETRSGDIINTLSSETKRLRVLFDIAGQMLTHVLLLVAYGAAIVLISWQMSILAALFGVAIMLIFNGFLRKLRSNGQAISQANAQVTSTASELISGIRTAHVFGTRDYETEQFRQVSEEARRATVEADSRSSLVSPLSQGIASTTLIVMIILSVQFLVAEGLLSAAALLAFMVALLRMLPRLDMINMARAQWSVYRGALDDVVKLLRRDDKPYLIEGDHDLDQFTNKIALRNVSFGYTPDQTVIKNVSLDIPRGQTVAIVGGSGAGKSTLADLIARLYQPDEGEIWIDDVPLHDVSTTSLRHTIAVVNQDTFLFNTSVAENITYGLEGISREEVRAVAAKANALDFINELPDGLDSMLGERGSRLSGGQRQRIAIARALLRNPDILILDEATSALDSVSEKLVQDSLEYLMRGRTVIVIAHRLSTVESADKVVVLEDGRITEEGSYQELLERRGQLWEYHQIQFQLA
jgi:subfamily B ATP-binding cassette protein MsbA